MKRFLLESAAFLKCPSPSRLTTPPAEVWIITSSNSQIADVLFDENGDSVVRITGIKAGSTSITIKASDKVAAKKQISVVDVLPEKITVTADTSKIYIGMEGTLSANFIPADVTNQKITWKSSAPRVLKVNSDGSYQALSAGEAITRRHHRKAYPDRSINCAASSCEEPEIVF